MVAFLILRYNKDILHKLVGGVKLFCIPFPKRFMGKWPTVSTFIYSTGRTAYVTHAPPTVITISV